MKKIVVSLFVLSLAVASHAQEIRDRSRDKKEHRHGMEFDKLNLSTEQQEKFKSERETFRLKMTELKKNENMPVKEYRDKMESLRKEHQSKIQGLLTPDQKLQLEKSKTEQKLLHEQHEKSRMENMKTKLGLSNDQAARMNKNRSELNEKMKTLRENDKLNGEQKRVQMKELMKEHHEKTKSILTDEQLKKLKEGREQPHDKRERKPRKEAVI
jgi:hypothetical protein